MGADKTMNALRQNGIFSAHEKPDFAPRAMVLALVIFAHLGIFSLWSTQADTKFSTNNELSVSFALAARVPQASVIRQQKISPAPASVPAQIAQPAAVAEPVAAVATQTAATAAPVVAVTEPDYKASYLNNPPPAYPMVARRQGLQGRVVLHVEVLADGVCGQINIQKSSGYAMLDNAALQTVKNWRFMPASRAGHAVDKWFMIPIQFSLKDNTA
jgi:protein TonB